MLATIIQWWKILSELGIKEGADPVSILLIKTINRVSFITAFLVVPFVFPQINPTNDGIGWIELVAAIGFLSVLLAHKYGKLWLGPVLLILASNVKIFFSASSRGFEAGEQLFFIPLLGGIITIYNLREDRIGQWMFLLTAGVWVSLTLTSYGLFLPEAPASAEATRHIFTLNFLISLFILLSMVFYYSRLSTQQQGAILYEKEKAEKASKAKSEFLSLISHELKTPLHGLLNFIEILKDPASTTSQDEILSGLSNSSSKLSLMVNNLLLVTDQDSTSITLTETIFNGTFPLISVANRLRGRAEAEGLSLEIYPKTIQQWFKADRQRIEQILENLVDNAIKFSPSGGKIVISLELLPTDFANKHLLRYSVSDQGMGIPEHIKSQIFLPFFMHNSSNTRQTSGAGLGLTVSMGLAKQMGGTMTVENTMGGGSTFSLEIPALIVKQVLPPTSSPHPEPLHILIVDDHPVNQKVASTMLTKLGYNYDIAANGEEALIAIKTGKFHLIFMDIQMPVMDGIEATRLIRDNIEDRLQPVIIALTANTTETDKRACFDSGMNDFLAKPVTKSAIGQAIDKWLPAIPNLP